LSALFVSLRFVLTNALMIAFIAALALGGWAIWAVVVFSFVTAGALDEALGDESEQIGERGRFLVDVNLYATLPLLILITYLLCRMVANPSSDAHAQPGTASLMGAVIGAGYFYALAGATVAHELSHRVTNPFSLICARVLLAFTINPSFETYHVHGHHRNVCTYDDPATARRGEYVLAFVVRTLIWQSIEGWRLEAERLRRKQQRVWSLHNRVLAGVACSMAILAFAAVTAGAVGAVVVLAAAIFGRLLHEMVNYVQHYGIVRADATPIEARHAWDCRRILSNALFYNLPRHADHHRFATKPYWELAAPAEAPKLPHGYQTMAMIALIPPWWHRRIGPLLADWDRRLANDVERSLVRERGWSMEAPMVTALAERIPDLAVRERFDVR
jgi:hypothetical protein